MRILCLATLLLFSVSASAVGDDNPDALGLFNRVLVELNRLTAPAPANLGSKEEEICVGEGDSGGGTLTSANTAGKPLSYTSTGNFPLTLDLPAGYAQKNPQTYIRFSFFGPVGTEDIVGDTTSGDTLDPETHWATGRPAGEGLHHAYMTASGGVRKVTVQSAVGVCVNVALVKLPDNPGDANLPYAAKGIGPRFATYTPKNFPGLGLQFAEPTLGVNQQTGDVFAISTLDVLRIRFDDSTTPARDLWESKPPVESSVVSLDPILDVDPDTGRVFSLNLSGPISTADYSDDGGETWLPGGNGFPSSGVDHQSLTTGPYPGEGMGALIPHPLYPNAVYYCSQGIADAYCSRSDTGGVAFAPAIPIYTNNQCTGLHGHVKVAPDGTVYVPNKACNLDFPTFGNGMPGVIVSEDAGLTWTVRTVGSDVTNASSHHGDPSVAIGKDNTVYYSYLSLEGRLKVAVSQDRGLTWTNIFDVGAIAGVTGAQFPAVVAGDAGRAAVAFLGTAFPDLPHTPSSTAGLQLVDLPEGSIDFPGVWYGYVATTLDFGAHWYITKVAPDDILQGPGGIGGGGDNRNLLDFNDAFIDPQGRVVAAFADGCLGGCQQGFQGNFYSNARVAQIVRQTGGPRMFAEFDPAEPAKPAAPRLTGYRTQDYVVLQIDADNGGAAITGYNIYRDGKKLVSNHPEARYLDSGSGSYEVSAINGKGESARSNVFAPAVDENAPLTASVCTLPGQIWLDQMAEPGAELPNADTLSMGIAEPQDQPGKLVFTVTSGAPGGSVRLGFDHPNGRRYSILVDANATTVTNTDGRWHANTSGTLNDILSPLSDAPALDSSEAGNSGVYTVVIDKETWGLKTGDVLRNVTAFGLQLNGTGQVFLRDFLGYDISQPIVGNDFCEKGAHLPAPFQNPKPPAPPVVTPPVVVAPPQGEGGFLIGAFSLLGLLPLAGLALLRRKTRSSRVA